ncbi:13700_t:CDS:1, partial [Acaulospora colombiana]
LFARWTFQSLQTLYIFTHLEEYTLQPNWLPGFLLRHQKSLLELGISFYPRYDNNLETASLGVSILNFFHHCPNLIKVGLNIQVFEWMQVAGTWKSRKWPRPPVVILLGLYPGTGLPSEDLERLVPIKDKWGTKKIVVSMGWAELGVKRASTSRWKALFSQPQNDLLRISNSIGIPILDQYGTSLQEFLE